VVFHLEGKVFAIAWDEDLLLEIGLEQGRALRVIGGIVNEELDKDTCEDD
jgi:hypothetical protein